MSHSKNSNIQQNQFASSLREKNFIDLSESDISFFWGFLFNNTNDNYFNMLEGFFGLKEKFKEGTKG